MSDKKKPCRFKTLKRFLFGQNASLIRTVSALVFLIILAAGTITFGTVMLLRLLGYFPSSFEGPLIFTALFVISSAIIGTIISYFVSKHVLAPLSELKKAMSEVEKGNFNVSVDPEGTPDVFADLIENFNLMTKELSGIEMFRSDFINSFSHEFKTPIVSIEGFAKRLKKEDIPEEKRREYIDIIISESKRLTGLSTSILLLNKLENQEYISDRSSFLIDEQLRNCILLLEKQWTKKNISFVIELEPVEIYTNQEMLSQAWLNILGNSIKFSGEGSEITVEAFKRDQRLRVNIADQGEGMDEETMRHIFERFYQGDSAHASEGNGLGLPLVKRIIELCGGTIRVESSKGKGTIFSVFFPL
ncbi:MAG: HAMP domain-containing histidine kinase [Ruminococcus sp.]|nr:HAMP domain-containing histidine kinase [Ruminococcus sp.]